MYQPGALEESTHGNLSHCSGWAIGYQPEDTPLAVNNSKSLFPRGKNSMIKCRKTSNRGKKDRIVRQPK